MDEKFKKRGFLRSHSLGPYNKCDEKEQWIRLSQGCPNQCPFCYEPVEEVEFSTPEIVRNQVKIMDMNLLSKPNALHTITYLGQKRVDNRVVYYELICGIDYRFLTPALADMLKKSRFRKIRMGWDFHYRDQFKIKDAITLLLRAGYQKKDITIFMICNWKVSCEECYKKLYLCAVWNVKVADCYFDGQTSPDIEPIGWTQDEIRNFRKQVRKHNQLVNFGIDPEIK